MSYYGEIVEPASRTAWEDWDEICSENGNAKLSWTHNKPVPDLIDTTVILEGRYLSDCIATSGFTMLQDSIKEVGLTLFRTDKVDKYICMIKDYNLLQSSEIIEMLQPYIVNSKNIALLQTKPMAEYQSFELTNESCLTRSICTSITSTTHFKYPKLEQPNIVAGVAAGVISMREHLGLPGQVIIFYIEHPEEFQVEEIQTVIKKLDIIPNLKKTPANVLNSNLYI